jgi:hypothetical protein
MHKNHAFECAVCLEPGDLTPSLLTSIALLGACICQHAARYYQYQLPNGLIKSEASVGAAPPATGSQLRLQRQTLTHAKLETAATSPPLSMLAIVYQTSPIRPAIISVFGGVVYNDVYIRAITALSTSIFIPLIDTLRI